MTPLHLFPNGLAPFAKNLVRQPATWIVLLGAAIILPGLGAGGLWDPWETHYAEVARRMLVDGDWWTPRWRNELFFSKPVLNFWLMAASFAVFGVNAFAARLPFALIGLLGVWLAYRTVSRLTDSRRGLWAAGVMATSPFYFFIARQAITDISFCVFVLGVLGNFLLVALEERPRRRDVLGIYVFAALAALAKTPVGLAIPGVVALAYLALTGDWGVLRKLKLHWGIPLFLLLAGPWYLGMTLQWGSRFTSEFFLHHNVQRAFTGVHGERGTFEYYLRQLGYGFFPWVGLLPLALARLGGSLRAAGGTALRAGRPAAVDTEQRLDLFLALWLGVTFATFTLIVTKFHHYVFPAVPPLAMLVGLGLAEREPSGWRLLAPIGVVLLAVVANDMVSSSASLTNLATYAYDRPLPEASYPRWFVLAVALAFGGLLLLARWFASRALPVALAALALVLAAGLSWGYLAPLGSTMGQQDLFDTYRRVAKPGEKLYQYQMNWRGEVFYSEDTIIKLGTEAAVRTAFADPKQRAFLIAVRDSLGALDRAVRSATGAHLFVLPGSGLRYILVSNQLDPGSQDLNPLYDAILTQAPTPAFPMSASWVDGIEFLGYDISPERVETGSEFELTLYFKCLRQIARNWQVFIHVDGHGHEFHRINGDHFPVDGLLPTDQWMAGDVIRDRVRLKVPLEFSATRFTIYLGFFIGDSRMALTAGAPQDGTDRLRVGTLDIH